MNLYISDLHFGHANAIRLDHRPFASVEEMDETIIRLWNDRVCIDDTVYIVGDFCYKSKNSAEWYLRRLRGHKILIQGNHDWQLVKNGEATKYFEAIEKMMHIKDAEKEICLCHFPIAEWNNFYKGSWHIYGHIHACKNETYQFMRTRERALNAGCMINRYTPVSFRELVENNETFNKEEETV